MWPMWLAVVAGVLLMETILVAAAAVYVCHQGSSEVEDDAA
jgi:hypothetical protein